MLGMGVAYDGCGSALITESEHGIWKAGRRCPDILLSKPGNPDGWRRLYSTLAYGFSIISCGGAISRLETSGKASIYRLLPLGETDCSGNGQDSCTFQASEIHPGEQFVVVVRPDTYIGYVGPEAGASAYLLQYGGSGSEL